VRLILEFLPIQISIVKKMAKELLTQALIDAVTDAGSDSVVSSNPAKSYSQEFGKQTEVLVNPATGRFPDFYSTNTVC
jgi:hypothetical protein